jgi:lipopolysaccharide export system protein LptC
MKNPKLIKLHAIKAELTTDQKGWSRMQAVRGLFNSQSERLVMQDDIRVSTSSGVTGKLTHASLEMKSQVLRSHQPVAFDLPSGTVRARALRLNSVDKTLLFRGKVRVHIIRAQTNQAAAGASEAPRPPKIEAPDAPSRVPPEASAAVPAEPLAQ